MNHLAVPTLRFEYKNSLTLEQIKVLIWGLCTVFLKFSSLGDKLSWDGFGKVGLVGLEQLNKKL